jgi:hypothetical protein
MTSTLSDQIRFDPHRARIPLPLVEVQRAYGDTFRGLWEFARTPREARDLGIEFVRDMIDATAAPLTATTLQEQPPTSVRTNR